MLVDSLETKYSLQLVIFSIIFCVIIIGVLAIV
jgi:hypothetical protein